MPAESAVEPAASASEKVWIDLFDLLGTNGCKLDCAEWQTLCPELNAGGLDKRTGPKRQMRKKQREFRKAKENNTAPSENAPLHQPKKRACFSFDDIMASAKSSCGVCGFLCRLLDRIVLEHDGFARDDVVFNWIGYRFMLRISDISSNRSLDFQLFRPFGSSNAIHDMPPSQILSGETSDKASLQTIRSWISKCDASHEACRASGTTQFPKRVLDLVELTQEGKPGIRLIQDEDISAPYACLSHCWGKDPMPVTTTEKTLSGNLHFILWDALPKTFQDAIIISRELGLRYLWIDSLCIIQDSKKDWEIESSKMADIYRNGHLTIAAASSPDFSHGCFPKKPYGDMCVDIELKDGAMATVGVRQISSDNLAQQLPLFTRAWVYQERMLSRRTLLCYNRELEFECNIATVCQCGSLYIAPHMAGTQVCAKKWYRSTFRSSKTGRNWHDVVTAYSALRLTKSEDRLPALSACASDSAAGRGRYFAGVWEQTLVEDLLWIINPPKCTQDRPPWRAPSWSWASVDVETSIQFDDKSRTFAGANPDPNVQAFRDRIIEVQCKLTGLGRNKFGAVDNGYMRLRTPLLPARLRKNCHKCIRWYPAMRRRYTLDTDHFYEHHRKVRRELCSFVKEAELQIPQEARFDFMPDFVFEDSTFDFSSDSNGYSCRQAAVWLMYICNMTITATNFPRRMYFMVLNRLSPGEINFDSEYECYERVGMVRIGFPETKAMEDWKNDRLNPLLTEERVITLK